MSSKKFPLLIAVAFAIGFSALLFVLHKASPDSHAATNTNCTSNAVLVNPCRPLIGAAAHGNPGIPGQPKPGSDSISQFTYLEQLLGNHLDIFRTYHAPIGTKGNSLATYPFDPNTSEGQDEIHFAKRANTYVDLNWNPSNSWQAASGGNATINKQIDQAAAYIKAVAPHKVFLSPWHEANLHVGAKDNASQNCSHLTSASNSNGTPSQFVAAWHNVRNRFKADGATNVVWIWGVGSYTPDNCWVNYMWPGNSSVDWVNYDTYGRVNNLTWDDSSGVFYNYLQSHSTASNDWNAKPWGIGEFGDADAPTQQDGYGYFNNITADFKANKYPKLKMYMIYADTGNDTPLGALTDFDSNGTYDPQKQKIINTMFSTMVDGTSSPQPSPTVSITSPTPSITVSASAVSVSAKASVSSGTITKLVLKAAGATLKTCTGSPCSTTWNTTSLANGGATVSATATASDGKSSTAQVNVTVNNAISPPSAPTNITSPQQTTTSISLTWKASTDSKYPSSQLTYHLSRNGKAVATTKPGTTTDTDTGLTPGTYYSYTITASDPAGHTSPASAAYTQTTKKPDCAPPKAPAGLTTTATTATSATLTWQAVANPSKTCTIAHYVVERSGVALAQPTTTSYHDSGLTPKTSYTYRVLAVLNGGIAGSASTLMVTTPQTSDTTPPTVPQHVVAVAADDSQINLTWAASSDPQSGIKQYQVFRNGRSVGQVVPTSSPSFGDSGLTPKTSYTYHVLAVNGVGLSAASANVTGTTLPASSPTIPGGTTGSGTNNSSSASSNPLLAGTTSVGSGSETGASSSRNPTAVGTSPATPPVTTLSQAATPAAGSHRTAYVATGVVSVVVIGAALASRVVWLRRRDWSPSVSADPDMYATIVRPNVSSPDNHKEE